MRGGGKESNRLLGLYLQSSGNVLVSIHMTWNNIRENISLALLRNLALIVFALHQSIFFNYATPRGNSLCLFSSFFKRILKKGMRSTRIIISVNHICIRGVLLVTLILFHCLGVKFHDDPICM